MPRRASRLLAAGFLGSLSLIATSCGSEGSSLSADVCGRHQRSAANRPPRPPWRSSRPSDLRSGRHRSDDLRCGRDSPPSRNGWGEGQHQLGQYVRSREGVRRSRRHQRPPLGTRGRRVPALSEGSGLRQAATGTRQVQHLARRPRPDHRHFGVLMLKDLTTVTHRHRQGRYGDDPADVAVGIGCCGHHRHRRRAGDTPSLDDDHSADSVDRARRAGDRRRNSGRVSLAAHDPVRPADCSASRLSAGCTGSTFMCSPTTTRRSSTTTTPTAGRPCRWHRRCGRQGTGQVGPSPVMAPAVLSQVAICLALATFRHPLLAPRQGRNRWPRPPSSGQLTASPGIGWHGVTNRATPPGWYNDPQGRFEYRYFNGVQWTSDVAVDGQRYVDRLPSTNSCRRQAPPRRVAWPSHRSSPASPPSSLGWVPFVFVVAACAAIAAIVFGMLGLKASQRHDGYGRGFAVAGLVLAPCRARRVCRRLLLHEGRQSASSATSSSRVRTSCSSSSPARSTTGGPRCTARSATSTTATTTTASSSSSQNPSDDKKLATIAVRDVEPRRHGDWSSSADDRRDARSRAGSPMSSGPRHSTSTSRADHRVEAVAAIQASYIRE